MKEINSPVIIKLSPSNEIPIIGIKLTEEKYTKDFIGKGLIHFSEPRTWRDPSKCSGKQLDRDEGCFCFTTSTSDEEYFNKSGRKFQKVHFNNGWKYYEDTSMLVGTCFYGILKSTFAEGKMQYGVKTITTKDVVVSEEYFKQFTDNDSENHTQKTIIIFDFYRFINLLISKIIDMGVSKDEIFISMVYYVNKMVPFATMEPFPFEFFLKDSSFSKQCEVRILIASKNKSFYKKLKNNNCDISIGDISSFTRVQDKYNSELHFSIQGDKLIYQLATPETLTLNERNFSQLVSELYQILQNQLPGEPKQKEELDKLAKPIIDHLYNKYSVIFKDDWRLYNVPIDLYTSLPELYKGLCCSFHIKE